MVEEDSCKKDEKEDELAQWFRCWIGSESGGAVNFRKGGYVLWDRRERKNIEW